MTGVILYDRERIKKNRRFAEMLCEALEKRGVSPVVALEEETDISSLQCDFIIRRCETFELSEKAEKAGIRVFNNSLVSRICNDKWATYERFRDAVPMCETAEPDEKPPFGFPCVVKSRSGHGGGEVFLAEDEESYKNALKSCPNAVVQPFLPCGGVDVRVYVLGGRVLKAVKRTAKKGFRSNFSLGGAAEEYFPDETMRTASEHIAQTLNADFVGVDWLLTKNGAVLNEIEDVVGTRMLYFLSLCDAADELADYAANTVSKI